MQDHLLSAFTTGTHNKLKDEVIPKDAASASTNWITKDGRIKLAYGKALLGAEGSAGQIYGEIFGYKVDGTKVHWRKTGTKIQYYDGSTWVDVVTGLSATDYTFSNYSSLAGTYTFAFGRDGIYAFHNANPTSYLSLYDSTKNFKGYGFIDKGRTILWNRTEDKTGLYGSYIDRQDATVYTTVSNENVGTGDGSDTTFNGTLAFKAGGATRSCFGVVIKCTDVSGEQFTDNYDGTLTGSAGGTGTINYVTGAWAVTFVTVPAASANNIKADYRWLSFNTKSVTDFTKSSTRVAGEGFVFPQDEGGDAIVTVHIGQDGAYYSLKAQSAYRLYLSDDDTTGTNEVYRRDIGVPSLRSAISTGKGIVFINTASADNPQLTILAKNQVTDSVEPVVLFPQFKFEDFTYSDATLATTDTYVLVSCRTSTASKNDAILLCDLTANTVDTTTGYVRTFVKDSGILYGGSSLTESVYKLYNGFDDDGVVLTNSWTSKGEIFSTDRLKKISWLRLKGRIAPDQSYAVYVNYDDAGAQLVGTIRGDAAYVDYNDNSQTIGSSMIGGEELGGGVVTNVYRYFTALKLKSPKFRKRTITFEALGIGYVDIDMIEDHRVFTFENKLPSRYRVKQNVSLDGTTTDVSTPEF